MINTAQWLNVVKAAAIIFAVALTLDGIINGYGNLFIIIIIAVIFFCAWVVFYFQGVRDY